MTKMIYIMLSLGALNAFIPLIIILILVAAAAGLMRGYNIFSIFGISALLGMSQAKGSFAGKNASRATVGVISRGIGTTASRYGGVAGKMTQAKVKELSKFAKSYAQIGRQAYNNALAQGLTSGQALLASKNAVSAQRHADKAAKLANSKDGALDKLYDSVNDAEQKKLISNTDADNIRQEILKARQSSAAAAAAAVDALNNPGNSRSYLSKARNERQYVIANAQNALRMSRTSANNISSQLFSSGTARAANKLVKLSVGSKSYNKLLKVHGKIAHLQNPNRVSKSDKIKSLEGLRNSIKETEKQLH
ncbi:MAG: hypothetical protein ACP5FN_00765 [Candidatus Micrarchaeia archaeon]